ncbi:metal-sulfur cluster assembly factor [Salibacterium aidingense]|uniref:metal-sulfur cluster assembly factor n=1 Tax=Salibacterium aidingense TaxID=384933 RepID=UPI0004234CE2|nr:iron-sulfur cluster assembly protein [Salibacterium aidingense]
MEMKNKVMNALKEVYDPELGINVIDLGLIYEIEVDEKNHVDVKMTLTTPGCPLHDSIVYGVKHCINSLAAVKTVEVQVVWEPAWTPEKMSRLASEQLKF